MDVSGDETRGEEKKKKRRRRKKGDTLDDGTDEPMLGADAESAGSAMEGEPLKREKKVCGILVLRTVFVLSHSSRLASRNVSWMKKTRRRMPLVARREKCLSLALLFMSARAD